MQMQAPSHYDYVGSGPNLRGSERFLLSKAKEAIERSRGGTNKTWSRLQTS